MRAAVALNSAISIEVKSVLYFFLVTWQRLVVRTGSSPNNADSELKRDKMQGWNTFFGSCYDCESAQSLDDKTIGVNALQIRASRIP